VTIRRRLPAAAPRRLMRDAGPPTLWDVGAMLAGLPFLVLAIASSGATRLLAVVVWLVVLAIPAILDRVGWRIRIGMAWLAAEQRRRLGPVRLPRTPAGADRWLNQPAAAETGLVQATVLMMAGDLAGAFIQPRLTRSADRENNFLILKICRDSRAFSRHG